MELNSVIREAIKGKGIEWGPVADSC